MPSAPPDNLHDLLATMKRAAAALRAADVEFMVGGGIAIWARGGPPTDHDVDLLVREDDAERALEALVLVGMRAERPPEDWLFKAWDGPVLVDLIFRPAGMVVDDEHFARATPLEVSALTVPVASIDDVLVTKLLALREQELDYRPLLEIARALREQIDWREIQKRTQSSPFARAFFTMVDGLGVSPGELPSEGARSNGEPSRRPAVTTAEPPGRSLPR
jgi:hypothetical protein